jgi:hypothetical protein
MTNLELKKEEIMRRLENARQETILCFKELSDLKEEVKNTTYLVRVK